MIERPPEGFHRSRRLVNKVWRAREHNPNEAGTKDEPQQEEKAEAADVMTAYVKETDQTFPKQKDMIGDQSGRVFAQRNHRRTGSECRKRQKRKARSKHRVEKRYEQQTVKVYEVKADETVDVKMMRTVDGISDVHGKPIEIHHSTVHIYYESSKAKSPSGTDSSSVQRACPGQRQ